MAATLDQAAKTAATGTVTLSGVDVAPSQTWNWLKINDTKLTVPEPPAADPAADVPAAARRITCGAAPLSCPPAQPHRP